MPAPAIADMYPVETINYILAAGTLALEIVSIALIAVYFLRTRIQVLADVAESVGTWGLWMAFLLTLGSTAMSLFYSDVLMFAPCWLCWIQRVFLYPQIVLFAIALWRRDTSVAAYSIALSILGAIVALYNHYLQMGGTSTLPCPSIPGADCSQRFLFEFGHITFPLMSFWAFTFLIIVMLFVRSRATNQSR